MFVFFLVISSFTEVSLIIPAEVSHVVKLQTAHSFNTHNKKHFAELRDDAELRCSRDFLSMKMSKMEN